jgi:hypothetical protein
MLITLELYSNNTTETGNPDPEDSSGQEFFSGVREESAQRGRMKSDPQTQMVRELNQGSIGLLAVRCFSFQAMSFSTLDASVPHLVGSYS